MNLKGLAYEVDPITPFFGNDEFERLSPLRRIPVLIDGDFSISDSSVICAYLDDAYPGHPLLPADSEGPRARPLARGICRHAARRHLHLEPLLPEGRAPARVGRADRRGAGRKRRSSEDIPAALDYLEGAAAGRRLPVRRHRRSPTSRSPASSATALMPGSKPTPSAGRAPRPSSSGRSTIRASPRCCRSRTSSAAPRSRGGGRRLLDAGAPLTAETLGVREPRKGMMRL